MVNSIDWEDYRTYNVDLLAKPIVNLGKIRLHSQFNGTLVSPPGWRKVSNLSTDAMVLTYEVTSIPETVAPDISNINDQITRDRVINQYYYQSRQYRLETYVSSDRGVNWVRRSVHPILRLPGVPQQTIDLLKSMNGIPISLSSNDLVAVGFRDVGFGLPKQAVDSFFITLAQACSQKIYEQVIFQPSIMVNQKITQRLPLANAAFRLLLPAEAGRKNLTFETNPTAATTTTTIRYGAPSDTTAVSQQVTGIQSFAGQQNYAGQVSFAMSVAAGQGVTATESF